MADNGLSMHNTVLYTIIKKLQYTNFLAMLYISKYEMIYRDCKLKVMKNLIYCFFNGARP